MAEGHIQYGNLVIDPPWPKRKGGRRAVRPRQGRALDYATRSVADIFALLDGAIFPLAAPTHNVFLWTIDQYLLEAEAEMARRGYRRHARLVWDKGNGVAPCFTVRYSHEYLLWCYRPRLLPVATEQRGRATTVIRAAAREHSRKPDEAYALVRALYPALPRLDVFSRERRAGWDQWGDQCDHFPSVDNQF